MAATPSFDPKAGTFTDPITVTISESDPATIYFTTDGTDPNTTSMKYGGPIRVTSTTTIKARAIEGGWTASNIAMASYKIAAADAATSD